MTTGTPRGAAAKSARNKADKAATTAKAQTTLKAAKPVIDLSALASAVTVAPELPRMRTNGAAADNPFIGKVKESFDNKVALSLPVLPNMDVAKVVQIALRRAAQANECGISIRFSETDEGVVITFQAKERNIRKTPEERAAFLAEREAKRNERAAQRAAGVAVPVEDEDEDLDEDDTDTEA